MMQWMITKNFVTNNWVKVEEALPLPNKPVLTLSQGSSHICIRDLHVDYDSELTWNSASDGCGKGDIVILWRYLPEPPKEDICTIHNTSITECGSKLHPIDKFP